MENKSSQNFGGEQISSREVEIFSEQQTVGNEPFISGVTQDMERDMGVRALEGIDNIAEVPADAQMNMAKIVQEGGVVSADGEGDSRTERGIDKIVEEAERSSEKTKGRPGDKEGEYQKFRADVLQSLGHYSIGDAA